MSNQAARMRRRAAERRVRAAWTWPLCEHCGIPRVTGTAAELVAIFRNPMSIDPSSRPLAEGIIRGIEIIAEDTAPEEKIGVCIECICIVGEDHPHPE